MIFDADVLIWALRDNKRANKLIDATRDRRTTLVTYLELVQGARDKVDLRLIRSYIKESGFNVLPLSENIGNRAAVYLEEYALRSGLSMGDALVAATATEHNDVLCTGNVKHFRHVADLELRPFHPV